MTREKMTAEKNLENINTLFEKRVNEKFFTKNFIGLSRTLSTYLILKKSLHTKGVKYYSDFEDNFTQFYKIRFASGGFTERFYKEMQELMENKKELDIDAITMSSNLDDDKKVQFSFLTKMFNIIDDNKYPIYDSNVATALGIGRPLNSDIQRRKEQYLSIYRGIQEIYKVLAISQSKEIESFKRIFNCPDLSTVRILDLIIWKLGEGKE